VSTGQRPQTFREERVNTWTSIGGLGIIVLIAPFLILPGPAKNPPALAWVFCLSAAMLYLASSIYHALPPGPEKEKARLWDHASIYLLIAGTYTPFALGPLREFGGWWLFGLQWGLASAGIGFVLGGGMRLRRLSNLCYLAMGWGGLFWLGGMIQSMPWQALGWLLGGGVVYSTGVIFYCATNWRFAHSLWHFFVITGTLCHAYAIWRYA